MKNLSLFISIGLYGCSIQSPFLREGYPAHAAAVDPDSISHTILLIGDAGEPLPDRQELNFKVLAHHASIRPKHTTVVFLGDNIYPKGLPDSSSPDRKEMERRLDEQIMTAEQSGAYGLFIPGNHDWGHHGEDGRATMHRQEEYIRGKNLPNVVMLPAGGYPGPSIVDIGDSIRIVAIDTHWWLHAYDKPLYDGDLAETQTKKRFLDSLSWALDTPRKIIVAGHHALESHGEHGGFFDWRDHIFPLRKAVSWLWLPLPGIGSLYPVSRMTGISDQDFSGSRYAELRDRLDSVFSRYSPVAYAAGHEHTLQVLERKARHYYLVSGKGIQKHTEALTYGDNSIFAHRGTGFMRLDFTKGGSIRLGVLEAREDSLNGVEVFSMMVR